MRLGLEGAEQAEAADEAVTEAAAPAVRAARAAKRRASRGSLPRHLPRIETEVDIADDSCPCCSAPLHRIAEDVSERLDVVPAQFRMLVVRRPKYACRACPDGVARAPAPARLIEGGLPTDATLAQVLVSKFADHLPLYRQAQIFARQGANLDRSTLADWVGRAALLLEPVHGRQLDHLKASTKPIAAEVLKRIAALYRIEGEIASLAAGVLRQARQERSLPRLAELDLFLRDKLALVSQKSTLAMAIRYATSRWAGLTLHVDDGRVEMDSNTVERSIRPLALTRKNALFADSDRDGQAWAVIPSRVETCKLNGVDPRGYFADVITRILGGHPQSQLDELMPWAYPTIPGLRASA